MSSHQWTAPRWLIVAARWIAVALPFYFLVAVLLPSSLDPTFSWVENALSRLGVTPSTALVFNSLVALGGALFAFVAFALTTVVPRGGMRVAAALLVLSGLFLSGVGLVPMNHYPYHECIAGAFFGTAWLAILISAVALLRRGRRWEGWFSALCAILPICSWAGPLLRLTGWAIPEVVSLLGVCGWGFIVIRRYLFSGAK